MQRELEERLGSHQYSEARQAQLGMRYERNTSCTGPEQPRVSPSPIAEPSRGYRSHTERLQSSIREQQRKHPREMISCGAVTEEDGISGLSLKASSASPSAQLSAAQYKKPLPRLEVLLVSVDSRDEVPCSGFIIGQPLFIQTTP